MLPLHQQLQERMRTLRSTKGGEEASGLSTQKQPHALLQTREGIEQHSADLGAFVILPLGPEFWKLPHPPEYRNSVDLVPTQTTWHKHFGVKSCALPSHFPTEWPFPCSHQWKCGFLKFSKTEMELAPSF